MELLDLIDQLASPSRLEEALQDDPDYVALVEEWSSQAGAEPVWRPRVSQWSLVHTMLKDLGDRLDDLIGVWAGERPERSFPTPVTALERVQDSRSQQALTDLVQLATPQWAAEFASRN